MQFPIFEGYHLQVTDMVPSFSNDEVGIDTNPNIQAVEFRSALLRLPPNMQPFERRAALA